MWVIGRLPKGEAKVARRLHVRAYPPWWRAVAAALIAESGASLVVCLLAVAMATDPPITPPVLLRSVAVLAVLPGLAAWLIGRAFAAAVEVTDAELVVHRPGERMEIPFAAIERIAPWAVPLPGPGFSVYLRSGRRLRCTFQAGDPTPLLAALAAAWDEPRARAALRHPSSIYARAKHARPPGRWRHPAVKFGLFALAPAAVLFNAHQHIAYGGTLGQYYLMGLAPYLQSFALHWATMATYLVLYASVWRGAAEGIALLAAWIAPARAAAVRRAVEVACLGLYYGGVPALVAARFLP